MIWLWSNVCENKLETYFIMPELTNWLKFTFNAGYIGTHAAVFFFHFILSEFLCRSLMKTCKRSVSYLFWVNSTQQLGLSFFYPNMSRNNPPFHVSAKSAFVHSSSQIESFGLPFLNTAQLEFRQSLTSFHRDFTRQSANVIVCESCCYFRAKMSSEVQRPDDSPSTSGGSSDIEQRETAPPQERDLVAPKKKETKISSKTAAKLSTSAKRWRSLHLERNDPWNSFSLKALNGLLYKKKSMKWIKPHVSDKMRNDLTWENVIWVSKYVFNFVELVSCSGRPIIPDAK